MSRQILAAASIFVMGLVSGYSVCRIQVYARQIQAAANQSADGNAGMRKLTKKLKLSPSQKKSISSIINAKQKDIRDLKASIRPRYKAIRETVKIDIQTILDDRQKEQFRKMVDELENETPLLKEDFGTLKSTESMKEPPETIPETEDEG